MSTSQLLEFGGIPMEEAPGVVEGVTYRPQRVVANGSFGVVYQALVVDTEETVAIKKVAQDKRYKNRELHIHQSLEHPNIVPLHQAYLSEGKKANTVFLNLVMDFIPKTLAKVSTEQPPIFLVKLFSYQLLRAIAYLHSQGVCHRDLRPDNCLINDDYVLKVCDFGSAKVLTPGEPNVNYVCSLPYRAPELLFGATDYSLATDVWSAGCIIAELALGRKLFGGEDAATQVVEIAKLLGTPTKEQIQAMNPLYKEYRFPQLRGAQLRSLFKGKKWQPLAALLSTLLVYSPSQRARPLDVLAHTFFNELRSADARLPTGASLAFLFDFSAAELEAASPAVRRRLVPQWLRDS